MSEIKDGDLVMVVRPVPCCGSTVGMGAIYTAIWVGRIQQQCDCCGEMLDTILVGARFFEHPERGVLVLGHMIERLKRIQPPGELEGEKRDEGVIAELAN